MSKDEISESRMAADIEHIAEWRESSPERGYHRPTFSASWKSARDYVIAEAERIGCQWRLDPMGNVHIRRGTLSWDEPAWICGSHLDTVPTGGKYDGIVGVVVALELLRTQPEAALELVIFAEEEGTGFGLAMIGSRAWAGTVSAERLRNLVNPQGETLERAGQYFGFDAGRIATGDFGFPLDRYRGMIEVHVEQGARLWKNGQALAVVTSVNGRKQYTGSFSGQANHAGSTAMEDRFDALAGAAEFVVALEKLALELHERYGNATITVGRLVPTPNVVIVIAGKVDFTVDLRSSSNEAMAEGDRRLRELLASIGVRRGLATEIDCYEDIPAKPFDEKVCELLRRAAERCGISLAEASSGALHDSAILAPLLPTAMLFVASRDGISHNPAEFSRAEDIAAAARIVAAALEETR